MKGQAMITTCSMNYCMHKLLSIQKYKELDGASLLFDATPSQQPILS
jgi:hypothetical protein